MEDKLNTFWSLGVGFLFGFICCTVISVPKWHATRNSELVERGCKRHNATTGDLEWAHPKWVYEVKEVTNGNH